MLEDFVSTAEQGNFHTAIIHAILTGCHCYRKVWHFLREVVLAGAGGQDTNTVFITQAYTSTHLHTHKKSIIASSNTYFVLHNHPWCRGTAAKICLGPLKALISSSWCFPEEPWMQSVFRAVLIPWSCGLTKKAAEHSTTASPLLSPPTLWDGGENWKRLKCKNLSAEIRTV